VEPGLQPPQQRAILPIPVHQAIPLAEELFQDLEQGRLVQEQYKVRELQLLPEAERQPIRVREIQEQQLLQDQVLASKAAVLRRVLEREQTAVLPQTRVPEIPEQSLLPDQVLVSKEAELRRVLVQGPAAVRERTPELVEVEAPQQTQHLRIKEEIRFVRLDNRINSLQPPRGNSGVAVYFNTQSFQLRDKKAISNRIDLGINSA
jgi:hypothetical protein